ncbi:PAS domain-containing protein [Aggregicoccus sp. 17bor-14]|uniref:sensor histidine kinase n=1 Tax=Myxococcaceae TaxID=31 RepID=UPI00129D10DC|nr:MULTISPECIES: ATP-binding protein [Myxococcaceae]MBF5045811.1 MASE1 domain-containing protein [Simulacricoccus sp. 17bor-14]MRI91546.1 PAS domain-containing protein [Aggregicoccus sp. 17bor-14]
MLRAHAVEQGLQQRPRQRGAARTAAYLLELLAIAVGYVLLGWAGHLLGLHGRVVTFWPAAGFALGVLLLRGTSRWPAILAGSVFVAWLFVLADGAVDTRTPWLLVALLAAAGRALSAVGCAWLLRRVTGTAHWPYSTRGVILATLVLGLVAPALSAVTVQAMVWLAGAPNAGLSFAGELWLWFVADSTGMILVVPLMLVLAGGRRAGPPLARGELPLALAAFVAAIVACFLLVRGPDQATSMAYPMLPLMVWACLRLGSRGAVLSNLCWAVVFIALALLRPALATLPHVFTEFHVRLSLSSAIFLVLAAAYEERYRLQHALQAERRSLEERVTARTHELASSLSLLHSSLESTADGLLVVDRNNRITLINQRFVELWHMPPDIVASGDNARALAWVQDQLLSPATFNAKVAYLYAHPELESADEVELKSGSIFAQYSRPQRLGEEIVGRVWSFRDITLRRRVEAERSRLLVEEARARQDAERAAREAREALALREDFLQVAAHEMKTPLTAMKIHLQRLKRLLAGAAETPVEAERLLPAVAAAERSLRRSEELSNQLLDVKQLSAGELQPRYAPLDFREAVAEQLEAFRESAARAHCELSFEPGEALHGESDPRQLAQIVSALLSNGIKFGAGQPLRVQLEGNREQVWLRVIDHGIGIAPQDQERILERFCRAVDSRHYGGLGLGLWLARRSAEALGGRIGVQSALARGSTFTVELPRWRPRRAQAQEVVEQASARS